jgi:hypothetical protein
MGAGIFFLVLFFVTISCGSTPPAEDNAASAPPPSVEPAVTETPVEETPVPETPVAETPKAVSQQMINDLNVWKANAEKNRTIALECKAPEYLSEEWNEIESAYIQANETSIEETDDAYQAAINNYSHIADEFETIAYSSADLIAEQVIEARSAAIEAGILDLAPEQFLAAEEYAVTAEAARDIKEYEIAAENAENALSRYLVLKTGMDVYDAKMQIENHRFASFDRTAINAADEMFYLAINQYDANDVASASDSAEKALSEYNKIYEALNIGATAYDLRMEIADQGFESVDKSTLDAADENAFLALNQYNEGDVDSALANAEKVFWEYDTFLTKAWAALVDREMISAAEARKIAIDAKAPVAAKPEFDNAEAIYNEGLAFFSSEDYGNAARSYNQSVSLFNTSAELSEYKRQQAQIAIEEAARRIAESEQTATDAETRLEGGVQ